MPGRVETGGEMAKKEILASPTRLAVVSKEPLDSTDYGIEVQIGEDKFKWDKTWKPKRSERVVLFTPPPDKWKAHPDALARVIYPDGRTYTPMQKVERLDDTAFVDELAKYEIKQAEPPESSPTDTNGTGAGGKPRHGGRRDDFGDLRGVLSFPFPT